MATIPLPALDTRPIQQPTSPLEMYGQMMGIKNMQQQMDQRQAIAPLQQQEAQEAVQSGQLDVEAKQRAAADAKAMQGAMQEWGKPPAISSAQPSTATQTGASSDPQTGAAQQGSADANAQPTAPKTAAPDWDHLVQLAIDKGASFSAVQALQSHVLDMKTKASQIVLNDARAGSSDAEALKTKNGMIIDALTGLGSLPKDQFATGLVNTTHDLFVKGLFDAPHVQMMQQLAMLAGTDPEAARAQLDSQIKGMGGFTKLLDDAQKQLDNQKKAGEADPTSPFYSPSAASVAMGTAPGAAQIQAGEVKQAARKAGAEESARMPGELALAAQRQSLSQGDPNAAGQLLVSGDATLAELKSRGATPDFIARALHSAHILSNGQYNAQAADAQFDVAKSPTNVQFFGSAKSLTDKGGTLDQLAQAAQAIPGGQLPVFNSAADWEKAATGSGPIAKYASLALGVADDYSKVMGGGQGSDASRTQALSLIAAKQSPDQRAASIEGIRGAVSSQMNSRIGKNPVLQRMYGSGTGGNSNDPFAQFGGKAH